MDGTIITSTEIKQLRARIDAISVDAAVYTYTPTQLFYLLHDCKRVIEGQGAIIEHLEKSYGATDKTGKATGA